MDNNKPNQKPIGSPSCHCKLCVAINRYQNKTKNSPAHAYRTKTGSTAHRRVWWAEFGGLGWRPKQGRPFGGVCGATTVRISASIHSAFPPRTAFHSTAPIRTSQTQWKNPRPSPAYRHRDKRTATAVSRPSGDAIGGHRYALDVRRRRFLAYTQGLKRLADLSSTTLRRPATWRDRR
jgi:hypothetical protein